MTTSGAPTTLSSAYTEILQSANGQIVLDASGQQSFIDFLGLSTCSGGGENVAATALVQVLQTTATTTSTFSGVPLAAVSATLTIAPVSYHIPCALSQNDLLPMTAAVSEAGYVISAMIKIRCPCYILYHCAELFVTDITILEICTIGD
jgi:acetylornithine/succinyldiaminopimelate/putrescine aminotransferase